MVKASSRASAQAASTYVSSHTCALRGTSCPLRDRKSLSEDSAQPGDANVDLAARRSN
ncbi:alpha-ketoglutarate-dependent 2,4-dichlorophenoxyacetate dioxygenase [Anopheles sinensis]|uniref:Alpha-ketoglutarate-dependent 2,4-dichlorophenoxyacetate dioxygenase n=1 Tax=Anopheles sinensis TaxID=74873 RepID=A0A084VY89_ANOSI|nr:alpha-ketoglutarate-dependent 2,4-dichlorophenoxyacetate dioxygenase [Anopheles sinensis]